jgi:uncharacterized protein YlxW (UPF0749 family)
MNFSLDLENLIAAIAGATGTIGGGMLVYSKMRRVLSHDALDASAHNSMQKAMEALRGENERLHEEVGRLRTEVNRLQQVITELTGQIATMSLAMSRNSVEDQLAREGKLDRRKTARGDGPYDSWTKPAALPPLESDA